MIFFSSLLTWIHYFTLGHSRDGEYFSWEHSHPIGSCTLGHVHLLEGDQIGSLHWGIYWMIWIIGLFHVILIAYRGIVTLLEVLTLRLDFLSVIAAYDGSWSYRHLGVSLLGILGWSQISPYLSFHTQIFHPWYFCTSYHTRAWSSPSFVLYIPPWHMTSPFSRLGRDVDQSLITLVVFIHSFGLYV